MIRKDFYYTLMAALLALVAPACGPATAQAGTAPSSTSVDTVVSVAYLTAPGGDTQIVSSNDAGVTISGSAAGVGLTLASNTQRMAPSTDAVFPITLRNTGSDTDTFTLTLAQSRGWYAALVADTYGDGKLHPKRVTLLPNHLTLAAGSSTTFLLVVFPATTLRPVPSDTAVLKAVSKADATQSAQVSAVVTVGTK